MRGSFKSQNIDVKIKINFINKNFNDKFAQEFHNELGLCLVSALGLTIT